MGAKFDIYVFITYFRYEITMKTWNNTCINKTECENGQPLNESNRTSFSGVRVAKYLVFCLSFFYCQLYCLSFFDLRLLITHLIPPRYNWNIVEGGGKRNNWHNSLSLSHLIPPRYNWNIVEGGGKHHNWHNSLSPSPSLIWYLQTFLIKQTWALKSGTSIVAGVFPYWIVARVCAYLINETLSRLHLCKLAFISHCISYFPTEHVNIQYIICDKTTCVLNELLNL